MRRTLYLIFEGGGLTFRGSYSPLKCCGSFDCKSVEAVHIVFGWDGPAVFVNTYYFLRSCM